MKTRLSFAAAAAALLGTLLLVSCEWLIANADFTHTTTTTEYVEVTYVAGYVDNGTHTVACYWKNGERTDLEPDHASRATGVFVDGDDVYVAGWYDDGVSKACYWKNGVKTDLHDVADDYSAAKALCVDGTDVYVAGHRNNGVRNIACRWKNDAAGLLDLGDTIPGDSTASAIVVSGTDVYVAGTGDSTGYYWKNLTRTELDTPAAATKKSFADDIAVDGEDVYVSGGWGTEDEEPFVHVWTRHASYWKNNVRVDLAECSYDEDLGEFRNAVAHDLYVINGDLYVAGFSPDELHEDQYDSWLWHDGSFIKNFGSLFLTDLTLIVGRPIVMNKPFVCGYKELSDRDSVFWAERELFGYRYTSPETVDSQATSIFVVVEEHEVVTKH